MTIDTLLNTTARPAHTTEICVWSTGNKCQSPDHIARQVGKPIWGSFCPQRVNRIEVQGSLQTFTENTTTSFMILQ